MNKQIFKPEEIEYYGRRVRRAQIHAGFIFEETFINTEDRNDYNLYFGTTDRIPSDVKLIGVRLTYTNRCITFYLEHESFDIFDDLDGRLPPMMTPSVRMENK